MPHKNRMKHGTQTMQGGHREQGRRDQGQPDQGHRDEGNREQHANRGQAMSQASSTEHAEGPLARTIEQATAHLPSDTFLWAACGCMGASLLLQLTGCKHAGLFVGQWVAPMMLFGIYNKIVKVAGSDRATAQA
jgi:hypothetical protein